MSNADISALAGMTAGAGLVIVAHLAALFIKYNKVSDYFKNVLAILLLMFGTALATAALL